MSKLFTGFKLKELEIKNRIVMAPMCMFCADTDGKSNDWHFTHYVTRAVGGAGLIIMEATGVESRGRITEKDLGLWKEEQIEGLSNIVKACKEQGTRIGIQLGHAGRKSEVLSEPSIAPSPVPFSENYRIPVEMTKEDINTVVNSFKEAARRANEAGFDTIEIHGAHGYLISEFLSPLTNHRTDEYGGTMENRLRFLREIVREIKTVWPGHKPIIVRVSAEDYVEEGNHDTIVADMLNLVKEEGIDLVNVSSGGVVNAVPNVYPGYQVTMAETIRKTTGLPVIAGGLITTSQMAEEIISNKRADLIFLGRELLRNPYWPLSAAKELNEEIEWPAQYRGARR
jgi:NADPH2 dehydrogenase